MNHFLVLKQVPLHFRVDLPGLGRSWTTVDDAVGCQAKKFKSLYTNVNYNNANLAPNQCCCKRAIRCVCIAESVSGPVQAAAPHPSVVLVEGRWSAGVAWPAQNFAEGMPEA